MNRDDIIRMAREAADETGTLIPSYWNDTLLERFAALVRADERKNFCALLRQMHDAYALQSDPTGLIKRSKHDLG